MIAAATATEIGDAATAVAQSVELARSRSDGDVARNPVRYPAATLFESPVTYVHVPPSRAAVIGGASGTRNPYVSSSTTARPSREIVSMTARRRSADIVTPVGLWSAGCTTSARAPLARAAASRESGRRPSLSIVTATGLRPSIRAADNTPLNVR